MEVALEAMEPHPSTRHCWPISFPCSHRFSLVVWWLHLQHNEYRESWSASIETHSIPEVIMSDIRTNFSRAKFGVYQNYISTYHPASNGLAEWTYFTSTKDISLLMETHIATNASHATTGILPSKLLMGQKLRIILERSMMSLFSYKLESR